MASATLPFGEWRPDIALRDSEFASEAENVLAGINSYKPLPSPVVLNTGALPATCVGAVAVRKTDGTWRIFAGTKTKLYSWSLGGWTDVTRLAGGNYNVLDRWSFAQFGDNLYACNPNDVLQSIAITAGVNFAAAAGSPPQAHTVHKVGSFLVLAALTSNLRKIRWSSNEDPAAWVVGVNLCDEQEFPDGGPVMGVAGTQIGFVLQDRAINSMQFLPGDTNFIFNFTQIVQEKGTISRYGYGTVGSVLYFPAEDGFYALTSQGQLIPIGHEKANDWWFANSDISRRNLMQCITSNKPYIIWPYYSSAAAPIYDKALFYNWSNQRFSRGSIEASAWAMAASVSLDLDTTGSEANDVDADSAARSLDSFAYIGGRPFPAIVNSSGQLSSLDGPPLPATLETTEANLIPGKRAFISDVRPLIDATNCQVAVATRERLQDAINYGLPASLEVTGSASMFASGRLFRARLTTQANEIWTHAQGVLVEAQPDGEA
jgi:hypothetical protein